MCPAALTFQVTFPTIQHYTVRILMIAPEPFFEPRGTPFSEYHRIRALIDLGHTVDLVTYPFGRDVSLPKGYVTRPTVWPRPISAIGRAQGRTPVTPSHRTPPAHCKTT